MPDFDVVVIGAGAAGLSVTAICAGLGLRTALVERGRMGGDCLNFGCVPSKALLAAAKAAHGVRGAARFGVRTAAPEIDWDGVRAHVRGAILRIAPNDSAARYRGMGVEVIAASAHFTAPDRIEAGGRGLTFRRAVIAAGSAPIVPSLPGLDGLPYLTNETIFDLPAPPGRLLILGGGPIGLELAQAHARLGCAVTVIEGGPRIAAREDPELVEGLRPALAEDGVTLIEGGKVARVEGQAEEVALLLEDGRRFAGTHLLLATGRAPRLAGLDLAAGNVTATPRGIAVGRDLRSVSNRRVWAVGDIADPAGIGPRAFTHLAGQHAGILVRSMLFRLPATLDYAALPRVTYTDPEILQVGLTEAEARAESITGIEVLRWPLSENDRAVAEGRPEGLVKLVLDGHGRLRGAGVVAPNAGEMAGVLGLSIGKRLGTLAQLVLPYPTLAEGIKRAAGEHFAPKLMAPAVKRVVGLLKRLP